MAKKARLFQATLRDGHGDRDVIFPAPSKNSLLNSLEIPPTVKLVDTKHLGWCEVSTEPNEDMNGVDFKVKGEKGDLTISQGDPGHDYLSQQFPEQVKAVLDHIDDYRNPDF